MFHHCFSFYLPCILLQNYIYECVDKFLSFECLYVAWPLTDFVSRMLLCVMYRVIRTAATSVNSSAVSENLARYDQLELLNL